MVVLTDDGRLIGVVGGRSIVCRTSDGVHRGEVGVHVFRLFVSRQPQCLSISRIRSAGVALKQTKKD